MVERTPLGLIAAGGRLPRLIAETALKAGRDVFVIMLRGLAEADMADFPHAVCGIGQFGHVYAALRQAGCRDLVLAGALVRPSLRHTLPDWTGLRTIPQLVRLYRGGDDHLLRGIGRLLEAQGFRLRAVQDVAPELLCPAGALTRHQPNAQDAADMRQGLAALRALGPFDVGQGLIIGGHRIVAVEAAEGTDGLLARMAQMRANGRVRWSGRAGLLVKAPKPGQDRRLDLPSIGVHTVAAAAAAGLRGVAVEAGATLVIDAQAMIEAADKEGLFFYGIVP